MKNMPLFPQDQRYLSQCISCKRGLSCLLVLYWFYTNLDGEARNLEQARLFQHLRSRMRRLGMAKRTELAYVSWSRRFILENAGVHPRHLGKAEVEAFLTKLAVRDKVAPSTQNQALSALLFLYKEILRVELPWMQNVARAKSREYVPVVLSRDEVQALLAELSGVHWLTASLLMVLECAF